MVIEEPLFSERNCQIPRRRAMKYSLILVVATASVISVTGKIPDYIRICKRNDPQLAKCILDSILNLRSKLVEGIPELAVRSIDPLRFDRLALDLGPGFKAEGRDLLMTGGKNFGINDLVVDIEANRYSFSIMIPEVNVTGSYEIDAQIASFTLKGRGRIHLTATSVTGRGTLRGKLVTRGGKTYNWFPSMNIKIDVGDYNMRLESLSEGDPIIAEVTNKLLNEEKAEVLSGMIPALEKALMDHSLASANDIVKTFTWDELFPES